MLHLELSTFSYFYFHFLEFPFTRRMLSYCGSMTYLTYVLTNNVDMICIAYVSGCIYLRINGIKNLNDMLIMNDSE